MWEGCQELWEVTSAFACWSRDAAASCGVHDNFPGGSFELLVKPLAAPTTPHRLWKGQAESFWDRVVAWTCHRNALGKRLVLDTQGWLDQAHNHWAEAEDLTYQKWHDQALLIFQGSKPDPCWLSATLYQQKQARKAHLAAKASNYQSWLTASMSAGMRPLFRSLSSPEAKVERPFLDSSLDFRPFLRLEFWAKLWKAQPSPLPPLESQLHQGARSHAASLSPLTLDQLKARLRKLSNKAGGADGWSYAQLKVLPDEALEALLKLFRRVECDGVLPEHWLTTLITMLPKNLQVERPIALCNAPYRLWAKLRYTEVELWVKNITAKAPWEHAIPGQSTLDVSIRRLLQAEVARARKVSRIVLFVDLQTFYESISHETIAEQSLLHDFPPVCADTALKVYRGARYIVSAGAVSPRCFAASGLMAGCPYAPALAKLALYPSLSKLHKSKLTDNITAWLDDVSLDTEGAHASKTAARAAQSFKLLKSLLQADALQMSLSKTCFVCTNAASEKALKKLLGPDDPPVKSLARDLGTDYSGARRRRITVAKERQVKGQARAGRLRTLRVPSLTHKWRLFKGGIFAAAAWGHQAQGIAPKRLKWLRACAAQQLQRHKLGSLDLLFDFQCKFEDPIISVLSQHFSALAKVFFRWPASLWSQLKTTWSSTWSRLTSSPHPWKCVSGPMAAAQAYLLQLGIDGHSLEQWGFDDKVVTCPWKDPSFKRSLCALIKNRFLHQRHERIASLVDDPTLIEGVDWTSHRAKVNKLSKRRQHTKWLLALWQGAVLHSQNGGVQVCPLCKVEATWQHVLLECRYWTGRHPEPPAGWAALQEKWPAQCLWQRGLVPKKWTLQSRPAWSFEQQREGLWACHDKLDASKFVFSTDASGGPDSADARLRVVAFALLAFTKDNDALTCVASITGFLPVGSSVAEGETRALFLLADSVEGLADVTCDCQSAIKKTQHLINLDCHWVRSHLSPEAFKKEFGEQQLWRMKANQLALADTKCGKAAASLVDVSFRNNVLELDRVAQQVSAFLAERVELLLTSTKDPPPLVFEGRFRRVD